MNTYIHKYYIYIYTYIHRYICILPLFIRRKLGTSKIDFGDKISKKPCLFTSSR